MSKITPKNLSYDSTLPPFLQRMQQHNSGLDGRHERAIARPKKARTAEEEEDDAPAYVVEDTNHTLSKEEYAAFVEGDKERLNTVDGKEEAIAKVADVKGPEDEHAVKEKIAAIGGSKKRKMGKIVGGEEDELNIEASSTRKTEKSATMSEQKPDAPKSKKKGKKIKLSFNDDEG